MNKYSASDIRLMSMLGQRGVLGTTLDKLAASNSRLYVLSADLRNSSGLDRFASNYPERFINVGIAEQNMIGVAAGLADSGYNVFATTFANFAALRACEFVRHFMGYMRSPVKLVGLSSGFATEYFGNTHYGIEDIAALRAVSNITIISPADGLETAKAVEALVNFDGGGAYLRLTGTANMPVVFKNDYEFHIGKAIHLKNGMDAAIIACGSMTATALEASKRLEDKGIMASVINMHTVKPLDLQMIDTLLNRKLIVTVEEHSTIGGMGGAVAEYLSEIDGAPAMLKIGIAQGYKKAGGYQHMLKQNGLTSDQIADAVAAKLGQI